MASKPEDRDPGHRSEETGPVKVYASATHTPPRPCGQSALRLGSLGLAPTTNFRVGRVSSAADRLHQQSDCAEFPFPVVKIADRSWRQMGALGRVICYVDRTPIIEVERRCGEPGTALLGTQNGPVADSAAASHAACVSAAFWGGMRAAAEGTVPRAPDQPSPRPL
jgi:hypothetical protein